MTYDEAVNYILDIPRFTAKTTLGHTRRLLHILGDPDRELRFLHVAGTNGKGSVCAAMDAMLRAAGHTTGLFTSPHLIRINERFMINGSPVSDGAFLSAFRQVMEAAEQLMREGEAHPTFFETLFLMGMLLFRDAGVNHTILETGMGGRLDATNVIERPLVCVITSISLDHTQYLGETIPEIAFEKAGIIKPGIPVVYDEYLPEANAVIEKRAAELGSPAYALSRGRSAAVETTENGTRFRFREDDGSERILQIPQIAPYQMINAALAWYALEIAGIAEEKMTDALAHMSWPCRMQMVEPGVLIDGAHNTDGIAAFIEAVKPFRETSGITLLFSAVRDKQYEEMIRRLAEEIRPGQVVTTQIGGARAVPEEELAELFMRYGCPAVFSEKTPAVAYRIAKAVRGDSLLFCAGSLYLAGELLKTACQKS